jgi:hypothetical protein
MGVLWRKSGPAPDLIGDGCNCAYSATQGKPRGISTIETGLSVLRGMGLTPLQTRADGPASNQRTGLCPTVFFSVCLVYFVVAPSPIEQASPHTGTPRRFASMVRP